MVVLHEQRVEGVEVAELADELAVGAVVPHGLDHADQLEALLLEVEVLRLHGVLELVDFGVQRVEEVLEVA